ncbi:MAG: hypothetical protein Q4F83_00755 [Eubacteriales bacterium]|nr:hypothetical protein [Eubacteriales bacterium]
MSELNRRILGAAKEVIESEIDETMSDYEYCVDVVSVVLQILLKASMMFSLLVIHPRQSALHADLQKGVT